MLSEIDISSALQAAVYGARILKSMAEKVK